MNNSTSNVQEAIKHDQVLQDQRQNISTSLSNVERKLNELKKKISQVDLGLELRGASRTAFNVSTLTQDSPVNNEISFTIRTNSSDGGLMSMSGEMENSQVSLYSIV